MVSACGDSSEDTTFDSVDDLASAIESEGFECSETLNTNHGQAEVIRCSEGHSLVVWGEDFEPEEMDPGVAAEELGEGESPFEHLRGGNWHIASLDADMLDDLESELGGERNAVGWPDIN